MRLRSLHPYAALVAFVAVAGLGLSLAAAPLFAAPPATPVGHGGMSRPVEDAGMAPTEIQRQRAEAARTRTPAGVSRTQLYPLYSWPLENTNHDSVRVVNYVDEDPTSGLKDYNNGHWTYDTHRGTDIALADFRAMDRGRRILSAAPGTVTSAVYSNLRDRNCDAPDNSTLNYVEVANGDGTYTNYFHLRANSMTVNVGETVQRGEVLGLAGSSGYSLGAHLHFEPADNFAGYEWRDPWGGPANPNPGLWQSQAPWEGSQHFRTYDFGVTTQTAAGGDLAHLYNYFCSNVAERMEQPAVFGQHEPFFAVWFNPQGLAGDSYRIEIHKPDQSLWGAVDFTLPDDVVGGYQYWYWNWDPSILPADFGTWNAKIIVGGVTQRQTSFAVGASSVYGPRFKPGVGRSFRINGAVQRDTLRTTALGGPVTYSLLNAAPFVTLADSIVTIAGTSTQPTRSFYFQAIAQDASARRDTAFFHVVDPSKTREPVVDVPLPAAVTTLAMSPGSPNPFASATTIEYALPRSGPVTLAILDLAGRRVRTLIAGDSQAPGPHRVIWDGRDSRGQAVAGGVYFCRLTMAGERLSQRIVRLP